MQVVKALVFLKAQSLMWRAFLKEGGEEPILVIIGWLDKGKVYSNIQAHTNGLMF